MNKVIVIGVVGVAAIAGVVGSCLFNKLSVEDQYFADLQKTATNASVWNSYREECHNTKGSAVRINILRKELKRRKMI